MQVRGFYVRRARRVVALALLVAAIGITASLTRVGFGLEEDLGLGWLFQLRGASPAPAEAVLVRFDRDTFARLRSLPDDPSAWPEPLRGCQERIGGLEGITRSTGLDRLPRAFHACLIRELSRRGATVIVFDIAFRRDPMREEGVPALAAALREHGRVVLLERAVRHWLQGPDGGRLGGVQADLLEGPHDELAAAAIATAPFLLPRVGNQVHQFWAFNPAVAMPTQLPVRALEAFAADALARFEQALGLPPVPTLDDRVERFRAEAHRLDDGLALAAGLTGSERQQLDALARVHDGPQGYYLNFYGPPGSLLSASAADLLLPERHRVLDLRLADLSGKVVFVGYAELHVPQASDSFPTPFSRNGIDLSGVEIAATGFANLLHDHTVRALPEWARAALVGLLGFGMVVASCTGRVWRGLVLSLALALIYAVLAAVGFLVSDFWLPVVVPLLLLLPLAIGLGQLVHYLGAARWLTIYTPRSVGRHLLDGHELGMGAARRCEVSVMLTDVVGFTSLAERSTPETVTEFVNRHFTMLAACVEAEAGTLAQFIGDSMMAFWGAPDPQGDHAARACRAALRIMTALEEENRGRAARGEPPVRIRIGINTGEVTAGNVGAPGRSHYGIVGDAVNTTQRIEQLVKLVCPDQAAAAILVSAVTRSQAGDGFLFTDAGVHLVRGRQEAVRIFRLESAATTSRVVVRMPAGRAEYGKVLALTRRRVAGGHG